VAVPLSVDLRSRIVNACKEHTKTDVAKIFQVDRKTVHRYLAQEKREGHFHPKQGYQNGHSHKLRDLESLRSIVEKFPTASLEEMGKKLNISYSTVRRGLLKLGITKKKDSRVH
jgi:transposase